VTAPASALRTDPTPWVFDADGHVIEPPRVWDELLPEEFRSYAPRVLQESDHYRFACGARVGFRIEGATSTTLRGVQAVAVAA
jgi:hypothetical protein